MLEILWWQFRFILLKGYCKKIIFSKKPIRGFSRIERKTVCRKYINANLLQCYYKMARFENIVKLAYSCFGENFGEKTRNGEIEVLRLKAVNDPYEAIEEAIEERFFSLECQFIYVASCDCKPAEENAITNIAYDPRKKWVWIGTYDLNHAEEDRFASLCEKLGMDVTIEYSKGKPCRHFPSNREES